MNGKQKTFFKKNAGVIRQRNDYKKYGIFLMKNNK